MTSIKLAVLKHTRAKDGSYKIRISIGHKSETHYIVTKYKVNSLANFVNGVVVGQPDANAINIKLRQLLNEYDERLERIPNAWDMSCEELRNLLRDMPSARENATFMQVADIYYRHLSEEHRQSTADLLMYHIKRFIAFTNGDIFLAHLTPRMVDEYIHKLRMNGSSNAYINISVSPIRTVVNYAIKMQYIRYDIHPFTYFHKLDSLPRDLTLPIEDIQRLFAYEPVRLQTRRTIDLFKLSFYLGGMNMTDLLQYDFRNSNISYIRQKTQHRNLRHTQFSIPVEAKPIIERYMNKKTGLLKVMGKGDYHSFLVCTDRSLRTMAKKLNLSHQRISFYPARKSFIQFGFDLGISLEILEYCSGQTMKTNRPIFSYAQVMSRHADDAIRRIINYVKTPAVLTDDRGNTTNQKPKTINYDETE